VLLDDSASMMCWRMQRTLAAFLAECDGEVQHLRFRLVLDAVVCRVMFFAAQGAAEGACGP
jgi:hypothetical protein